MRRLPLCLANPPGSIFNSVVFLLCQRGEFSLVKRWNIYIFCHCLESANLMDFILPTDEFSVELEPGRCVTEPFFGLRLSKFQLYFRVIDLFVS